MGVMPKPLKTTKPSRYLVKREPEPEPASEPQEPQRAAPVVRVADVADDLNVSSAVGAVLSPWQERYAEWMVSQGTVPDQRDRAKVVSKLVGREVRHNEVAQVERMPAFRAYLRTVMGEVGREARAVMSSNAREAMEGHVAAIQALKAAEDWKTLHKYTTPILDRVWPKREDAEVSRAQIVINLGVASFAGRHLKEIPEAEVEILVTDPEVA